MRKVDFSRREFLRKGSLLIAAPAIVRISSLMPVKAMIDIRPFRLANGFGIANMEIEAFRLSLGACFHIPGGYVR